MIPDSLQTLGDYVFADCYKLVPSSINVDYGCCMSAKGPDSTSKGRRLPPKAAERTAELEKMLAERDEENDALNAKNVKQASEIAVLTTENAEQATEIAALTTKNTALTTETAAQATVIATLTNENAALKIAALTTDVLALKIANAPAPHTNDFISTIDFKRHFVGFVHIEMLLVLREVCKEWNDVVVERVDESVESGVMIVHEGKDIDEDDAFARKDRCELVMQVIFLPNITKVGENVCDLAANLVVVHIPEGAVSIGEGAFLDCHSLTTVSFPATSIGVGAFELCFSLDNVDLLHTNPQEIDEATFRGCWELKSMTIPESLQMLGRDCFRGCDKLVPSSIDVHDVHNWDDIPSIPTLPKLTKIIIKSNPILFNNQKHYYHTSIILKPSKILLAKPLQPLLPLRKHTHPNLNPLLRRRRRQRHSPLSPFIINHKFTPQNPFKNPSPQFHLQKFHSFPLRTHNDSYTIFTQMVFNRFY
ncbi:hypothetical protein TL16_g01292 [Triparma laevis f. inornata]|uniref:Uncharacterized protein n=1 Tax=Triparma laevis f. inornata TaxID=1714386 RepID=A0A9W6ZLJ2_9STRA|nr:hypothetical protein TL16_g01292 [Triparma laevis f. inornata]